MSRSFESISRCEASGEILSGGNIYTSIDIEPVAKIWAETNGILAAVIAGIEKLKTQDENTGVTILDGFTIYRHNSHLVKILDDAPIFKGWLDRTFSINDAQGIAVDIFLARQTSDAAKFETFQVTSSNGALTVNKETGEVVKCEMNTDGEGIDMINKFNLDEWKSTYPNEQIPASIDILDLGYWTIGTYEEPSHEWRKEFKIMRVSS